MGLIVGGLEALSEGGGSPGTQGRKKSPKSCLRPNSSYIVHVVGLEGIVPQLSGPGGCGMWEGCVLADYK